MRQPGRFCRRENGRVTAPGGPPGACDRLPRPDPPEAARASRGALGVAGGHRALWLEQRGVPVELRPRHTERGTGVRGQGPAPARQGWPRSPTSGYRAGICARPPGPCGPPARLRGCASPGARRAFTHPPTPRQHGRAQAGPSRRQAHRDPALQGRGAPGLTSPEAGGAWG